MSHLQPPATPRRRETYNTGRVALEFTVRFNPEGAEPGDSDVQPIRLTFDDAFEPAHDVPLNILVQADGTAVAVGDASARARDTCSIHETVNLFPDNRYSTFSLFRGHAIRVAWTLALVVATLGVLAHLLFSRTMPLSARMMTMHTDTPTPPAVQTASIPLFDDIIRAVDCSLDAPLPLVVGTQDLVRRHYEMPHSSRPPPPLNRPARPTFEAGNVTAPVFLAHFRSASSELCDAAIHWAISCRSPLKGDIIALCHSVSRAAGRLRASWSDVAVRAMLTWPVSLSFRLFSLSEALETFSGRGGRGPADDYALVRTIDDLFFRRLEVGEQHHRLPPLSDDIRKLAHGVREIEAHMETLVTSLTLLTTMLGAEALTRKAWGDEKARWFGWRRGPEGQEQESGRLAAKQDAIQPLLHTFTALLWTVGLSRRELDRVVTDLQAAGNLSATLLLGTPWVTESGDGNGGRVRTTWSVPQLDRVTTALGETSARARREAGISRGDLDWWIRETAAHYKT